jgi:3,4-dihydroxy 2-butanone 4-phosphate synthase / GTP cyclohydrolase II
MSNFIQDNITKAISEFKKGNFVIIMDSQDRENEGDLVIAAQFIDDQKINFMLKNTSGILCTPITQKRAVELELNLMTKQNTDKNQTNFTISCDLKHNITTGVSCIDRAKTCKALADEKYTCNDFTKPGHIFPLVSAPNGFLDRKGHTEATIEMCKLCNLKKVGVIGELKNDDGTMKNYNDCLEFSQNNNIPLITIEEMVHYLNQTNLYSKYETSSKIKLKTECELNLKLDKINENIKVQCQIYWSFLDNCEHIVLIHGDITNKKSIPLRIHSECFTGNVLHSLHCDCYDQFQLALEIIKKNGYGILIYHSGHEGRGIGIVNKIKAYNLQQTKNFDTVTANTALNLKEDYRNYQNVIEICNILGITKVDLITNNPKKCDEMKDFINNRLDASCIPNIYNKKYLETKKEKMNHTIDFNLQKNELRSFTITTFENKREILESKKIAIIKTNWNKEIIDFLSEEYRKYLQNYGIKDYNIDEYIVPGAYELPFQAKYIIKNNPIKYNAIICIGAVIKGETPHFEYISNAVSMGIMNLQLEIDIPIIYGVLSCYDYKQAQDRTKGEKALQEGWANSTIQMIINCHQ